jgi:Family of unknown function (DUF5681)
MDDPDIRPEPVPNVPAKARGRPFNPGKSGNPAGRPKGARNKATIVVEALLDGDAEALMHKVIEKAKDGDMAALRFCLERLCPARRDRLVNFEMPKIESAQDAAQAASAVLAACAAGQISPGEATEIMTLVGSHVRVLETSTFEARLTALQSSLEGAP